MTDEQDSQPTRPISVAELLAKNGTIGSPPVTGRRRRRRGNSDAVTVAELTGEIPIIRDDHDPSKHRDTPEPVRPTVERAEPTPPAAERAEPVRFSEPQPRWPQSPPQRPLPAGPPLSRHPLPARKPERVADAAPARAQAGSDAERMRPDPLEEYSGQSVDVMDAQIAEAEPLREDSAYVRSFLRGPRTLLGARRGRGGRTGTPAADEDTDADLDEDLSGALDEAPDEDFDEDFEADFVGAHDDEALSQRLLRGAMIVGQSILAVAFGAGLFIAFDQLWRWNSVLALVLAVLVILGLVAAVRVVRKTEDIASTLIAVAVGALVALGPLAMLQSG